MTMSKRQSIKLIALISLSSLTLSFPALAQESISEEFLNAQIEQMRHYDNKLIQITIASTGLAFASVFGVVTLNYLSLRSERDLLQQELKAESSSITRELEKDLEAKQTRTEQELKVSLNKEAKENLDKTLNQSLGEIQGRILYLMRCEYDFIEFKEKLLEKEGGSALGIPESRFNLLIQKLELLCPDGNLEKGVYGSLAGELYVPDVLEDIERILTPDKNHESVTLDRKLQLLKTLKSMPRRFEPLQDRIEKIIRDV
jgi:hypothetical protein